ncbi:MAG: hypothetical protein AAB036_01900 [Elusimicrobiota bacterium]|mgnify:CR=1 FL=1
MGPDGSLWITDSGRDRVVRYTLPLAAGSGVAALSVGGDSVAVEPLQSARRFVEAADGASVERDDGAGVWVPQGALGTDLEITVDEPDENQDTASKEAKRRDRRLTAAGPEVRFGPEGTVFNTLVTLTLPYDVHLSAARGLKEDDLKIHYWNASLQDWQALASAVDKQNQTLSAQTQHFSVYQVMGPGGGIGTAAALDEFSLRDAYAFPSPSRGGAAVTLRLQPGRADSVEVRIYDASGRKVHSSSDFRFSLLDDGNGKGNQNTYDHSWDVSGVASGVYTYTLTAKKAGSADIRKTGKVGVVK